MKKKLGRIVSLLLCVLFLEGSVLAEKPAMTGAEEYMFLQDLISFINENAKFPAPKADMLDAALCTRLTRPETGFNGMVEAVMETLDEHSSDMTEETYTAFQEETIEGEFTGIGVTISQTEKALVVISAIADSPAEKAGILPGDILTKVDGVSIENEEFEAVRNKIRGPENTTVEITVRRGKTELSFTVLRTKLSLGSVTYEKLGTTGYLQLSNFTGTTSEEVRKALSYFDAEGTRNLILDLRNNPGGELGAALDVCRQFVPKGVIMRVEYANNKNNTLYYNETDPEYHFNLVVLINEGSASAAELLAGAILDTDSGYLIGTNTFGKGTVQTIIPITTGGALRLTVAEYKTAGGRAIHHKGIAPDLIVRNKKERIDTSYMAPMAFETEWKKGDESEGVLAIEQRLSFWGYIDEADRILDAETEAALRLFQAQNRLEITGNADIYTQIRLSGADYDAPVETDNQLEKALEYFNEEA